MMTWSRRPGSTTDQATPISINLEAPPADGAYQLYYVGIYLYDVKLVMYKQQLYFDHVQ